MYILPLSLSGQFIIGFDVIDAARIFHKLMTRLGHDRYYVQGGDYGALISRFMGALYCRQVDRTFLSVHLLALCIFFYAFLIFGKEDND